MATVRCEPREDGEVEVIGSGDVNQGEAALLIAQIVQALVPRPSGRTHCGPGSSPARPAVAPRCSRCATRAGTNRWTCCKPMCAMPTCSGTMPGRHCSEYYSSRNDVFAPIHAPGRTTARS